MVELSFRVYHPSTTAAEISARLGWEPQVAWSAGDRWPGSDGKAPLRFREETYCVFALPVRSKEDCFQEIDEVLNRLDSSSQFWREFLVTDGSFDFFVGIFASRNFGLTISSNVIARMAEWQIELGLDFYGAYEAESEVGERQQTLDLK